MITTRKASERGYFNHGWLETSHTFSFGEYYDKAFMGFHSLRVINDDWVAPGMGFGTHAHQNMEIISYVLQGTLEHKDSMGTGSLIPAGSFQYMSAGSGVQHSEFNPSNKERVNLLQIWIKPNKLNLAPRYAQTPIVVSEKQDKLFWVAGHEGSKAEIKIRQQASLFVFEFKQLKSIQVLLSQSRFGWLHVTKGSVEVAGNALSAGDACSFENESDFEVKVLETGAEFLFFDLE